MEFTEPTEIPDLVAYASVISDGDELLGGEEKQVPWKLTGQLAGGDSKQEAISKEGESEDQHWRSTTHCSVCTHTHRGRGHLAEGYSCLLSPHPTQLLALRI